MTGPIDTARLEGAVLRSTSTHGSRARTEDYSTSAGDGEVEKNGETTLRGSEEDSHRDDTDEKQDLEIGEALNDEKEVKTIHKW